MSKIKQELPMAVYSFKLTTQHIIKARQIGKKNQSEGVRLAIEAFKLDDRPDLKPGFIERRKNSKK